MLWVELPQPVDTRVLFDEGLSAASVLSRAMSFRQPSVQDCLRLSCGNSWEERIEEGIETIGALAAGQLRGSDASARPRLPARAV